MLEEKAIVKNQIKFINQNLPGIYFLLRNNKIVYVGQCKKGLARLYAHCSDKKFDGYYFKQCDVENLNNIEAYYICNFEPQYNQTIPSNEYFKSKSQLKEIFKVSGVKLNKMIREKQIKPYFHGSYFNIKDFNYNRR